MDEPGFLRLSGIASRYGSTPVLNDIELSIARGEFVALRGSPGCGKTTLLRVLAGFITQSSGRVWVGQRALATQAASAEELTVITAGDQNMVDYVNQYLGPLFEKTYPGNTVRAVGTGPSGS